MKGAQAPMGYAVRIQPGKKVRLSDIDPNTNGGLDRKSADELFDRLAEELGELQELLYAASTQSLLVILQGIDTAGKDGAIRHVFRDADPLGTRVVPFKVPTPIERDHDFLWRVHKQTPEKGMIGIFNRSHYEDVLVVRVHELAPKSVWSKRFEHDHLNAAPSQSLSASRPGDAGAKNGDAVRIASGVGIKTWTASLRARVYRWQVRKHRFQTLPLGAEARLLFHRKSGLLERAPHIARHRECRNARAGRAQPRHLGKDSFTPHPRISRRGEAIEEPGVEASLHLGEDRFHVARKQGQRESVFGKPKPLWHVCAYRPARQKLSRKRLDFGKMRQSTRRVGPC